MTTPRTSFVLPDDLKAGLEALKARDGISGSEAMRRAIAEYLVRKGILRDPAQSKKRTR
jgi:hypothetical protein